MNWSTASASSVTSGLQSPVASVSRDSWMVLASTYSSIDNHAAKMYNYTIVDKEDTYAQTQPAISR